MNRIWALALVVPAILIGFGAAAVASPPQVNTVVVQNLEDIVPVPPACQGAGPAVSDRISYNLISHEVLFSPTVFHVTTNLVGSFDSLDAKGAVIGSGHFSNHFSDQVAAGENHLYVLNATGRNLDGSRISVHILQFVEVTPNGDLVVDNLKVAC